MADEVSSQLQQYALVIDKQTDRQTNKQNDIVISKPLLFSGWFNKRSK